MKMLTYVEIDVPTFVSVSPEETETYRFAIPADYLPADIECIPSIDSVSVTPARVSLGENLGQRASISVQLRDHRHIFAGEAFSSGTFFGKWRARYGTKLRGRPFRLIRGQLGQTLEQMDTRYYVIERVDGPSMDGTYTIEAKDILKLADNDRAQAPVISGGQIAPGGLTSGVTSVTLVPVGIGDEYPDTGWLCFGGKEICSFTKAGSPPSGDVFNLVRGQLGTEDQDHDDGSRAQIVLRYTGDNVEDITYDLLVNYAAVDPSYITLSDWQAETAAYLGVIYARTIPEPTSVRKLLAELVEQAALALFWDDKNRQVRLKVLREIATDTNTFDADSIIEGSFSVSEQHSKRISQIWTYYGQRDSTDSGASEDNYRSVLADVDLEWETDYGSAEIRKIKAAWVETLTAATRLNSLQLSRYRDPPRTFTFDLFAGADVELAIGYKLGWWGNQDTSGNETLVPVQVTQVTIFPDRVHVEAEEMLASGDVVLQHTVFLSTVGAGSFSRPATWNDANNSIECIAGGGGGKSRVGDTDGGGGGGGGGFSKGTNIAIAASETYYVGDGGSGGSGGGNGSDGEDTFFGAATLAASDVGAEGGKGSTGRLGASGGLAANGIGTTKYSGGDGGNGAPQGSTQAGGGGGGGAAGPHGDGAQGGDNDSTSQDGGSGGGGANGGSVGASASGGSGGDGGENRFGTGGGNGSGANGSSSGGGAGGDVGADGGDGGTGEQWWTQTVAPITTAGPGGGGGGGGNESHAGDGGLYGGGGGGAGAGKYQANDGGDGKQGIIVISWTEA